MAKKENGGKTTLYWVGGIAATAGVYFLVQRYLRERDELMELKAMERLRAAGGKSALAASNPDDDNNNNNNDDDD